MKVRGRTVIGRGVRYKTVREAQGLVTFSSQNFMSVVLCVCPQISR